MRRLKIEELQNEKHFSKIAELKYDHIINFVFQYIKKPTPSVFFYFFSNAFLLAAIIYFPFTELYLGFGNFLTQFFAGLVAGSFLIVPIHELCHGFAFKLLGASKIHFGADMKQMIFYVAADKFIVGRYSFYLIALMPFILINLTGAILLFYFKLPQNLLIISLLFFHNIMCIGDFAMISFFQTRPDKELYTYDDHENKISFVFEKND